MLLEPPFPRTHIYAILLLLEPHLTYIGKCRPLPLDALQVFDEGVLETFPQAASLDLTARNASHRLAPEALNLLPGLMTVTLQASFATVMLQLTVL